MVAAYCQSCPFGEKYAMPSAAPAAVRPGLTAMSPEPSKPRPLISVPAPWSAGIITRVHAVPPLVLSHAAS